MRGLFPRPTGIGVGMLLLLLLGMQGCGGGDGNVAAAADPTVPNPNRVGDLELTLTTTKRSFAPGETIPMTFTVKNVGAAPLNVVRFGCIPELTVSRNNQVVGPEGHGCSGGSYTLALASGEARTFPNSWNQKDIDSNLVSPGTYVLNYELGGVGPPTSANALIAHPITIQVLAP